MKFEISSKFDIEDNVRVKNNGLNAKVINIKFKLPAPNTYHIYYLVEFEDETRLWYTEDAVSGLYNNV